jgi:hypothetical protein
MDGRDEETHMQHEDTRTAMSCAGLTAYETWMHYCNMGGYTDYFEFDAYLFGLHSLEPDDADLVSQAVNELIDDTCLEEAQLCRAPYSWLPPVRAGDSDVDPNSPDLPSVDADPVLLFGSRPVSDLGLRALRGRPGIPCPPGSRAELLGDILDSGAIARIVHRGSF